MKATKMISSCDIAMQVRGVSLVTMNDSLKLHPSLTETPIHTVSMTSSDIYDFDTTCLPAGCYKANLQWNRTVEESSVSTAMGLLAYIPQCGAFLSPLLPTQEICMDESVTLHTGRDGLTSISHDLQCRTACQRKDHVLLDITLQQTLAEGWLGSYYTVHKSVSTDGQSESGWKLAGASEAISGGTMEWGLDENRSICLPTLERCYEVWCYAWMNAVFVPHHR